MDVEALIEAVEAIPNHYPDGREWEWGCENRRIGEANPKFADCPPWPDKNPDHDGDLISRERVLALLRELDPVEVAPYIQPTRTLTAPITF